jgi:hypothetical protein
MDEKDFFTLAEMAELMGINERTLKNRICSGKGHPPVFRPAAGVYQFSKREYQAWRVKLTQRERATA